MCGLGDDAKTARAALAIVNGTPEPTLHRFTPGQTLAMGGLVQKLPSGEWFPTCNATLVAEDAVLTAAHCALGDTGPIAPEELGFALGEDLARPTVVIAVREVLPHPGYDPSEPSRLAEHDLAILFLDRNAVEAAGGITPLPWNRDPLAPDRIGRPVQIEGFGDIEPEPATINPRRYFTVEPIVSLNGFEFAVDGQGVTGVCSGDSGGPAFDRSDDDPVARILGVVSWGDYSCVGVDHFTRVDAEAAWLDETLADRSADYCRGVGDAGLCLSGVRFWCLGGAIAQDDCVLQGGRCVETGAGSRCEDAGTIDPCNRLGFAGACNPGEVAVWCENGEVKKRRCAPCGQVCAWTGSDIGYYCVD